MVSFIVLVIALLIFRGAGLLGLSPLNDWLISLRAALAVMFLVTASAHWGKRHPDLIRMVPPAFPRPDLLVTITGVLEILGAIGLLVPSTARVAAGCLAVLLVAMFPANVYAAQKHLAIDGRPANALWLRLPMQILYVACLVAVGLP